MKSRPQTTSRDEDTDRGDPCRRMVHIIVVGELRLGSLGEDRTLARAKRVLATPLGPRDRVDVSAEPGR